MRAAAALLVAAVAAGCAATAIPPPPQGVRQLGVLPPLNRTGRELMVSGDWWLERALGQPRAGVTDVLADEARTILARRGFRVLSPGSDVPGLRFVLRRWMPDPSGRFAFVGVDVRCELLDPNGKTVRWSATRRRWTVPVRGAASAAAANERAARIIAETFLASWQPAS